VALKEVAMKQRRIGLTGGIASGKSTVGALLSRRFGLPVLDADLYAREALAPGTAASDAVLARYGAAVQAAGSEPAPGDVTGAARGAGQGEPAGPAIDRAALGQIVFADAAERQWLEQLIHPLVRRRFAKELARLAEAPVLVLMIPLLFEAGLQDLCNEVWVVDCEPEQQLNRLMARDGLNADTAHQRLAAQWPLARKRALADVVISNDGGREQLLTEVRRALGRDAGDGSGATGGEPAKGVNAPAPERNGRSIASSGKPIETDPGCIDPGDTDPGSTDNGPS
jgi:dephospho-CoA kinase